MRMAILDEWSQHPTTHERGQRSVIADTGNIVADMRTIAFMEQRNTDRAEMWKSAFAEHYGEEYQVCVDRSLQLSHEELNEIFNMNSNVKVLYKWRTRARKEDREVIDSKCSSIIGEWRRGTEDLLEEGSGTMTDYREAVRLYYKY